MIFPRKNKQITVQDNSVSIMSVNGEDYICLTDMVKSKDGEFFVKDWLRNRNTLEFLSVWEAMHNPEFTASSISEITEQSGLNTFKISVKEWIERTNAKGIVAKKGRTGGTYAHRDIAFEFGTWISPVFKLYLIKEYQRLKEIENNQYNLEWNVKRIISKANYQIHTDAVKTHLVPKSTKWRKEMEYAEEADILNVAIFGCTAKEWRNENPERDGMGENIRDTASINELVMLSNLESMNAKMIRDGTGKQSRFEQLQSQARHELEILNKSDVMKALKKTSESIYLTDQRGEGTDK